MIVEHGWRIELDVLDVAVERVEVIWPVIPRMGEYVTVGDLTGVVRTVHYHGDDRLVVVFIEPLG